MPLRPPASAAALVLSVCLGAALRPGPALGQADSLAPWLADRGPGIPASLFGTYLRSGELVVYPFFESTLDNDREYQPEEFGLGPDVDFRGRFRGTSNQLFVGYGVSDRIAVELEAAYVTARLEKSPADSFATPAVTRQSGVADLEAQVRARLLRETSGRPELFGFVELAARSQRSRVLIGELDWDAKPGIGLVRGFGFGTVTVRIAAEWNHVEHKPDLGEFALEYLKRVGTAAHLYLAVEGGEGGALDEWDFITGVRWRIAPSVDLKLDDALGISSKATDWAPQAGVMFHLGR
jgi:hypothetical protein